MTSIRIIGAGSIGNHIAHAARSRGWDVLLTDNDQDALRRTREEIYPGRYGSWDEGIQLADSRDASKEGADVVFIGTPPDSHLPLAREVLEHTSPRALVIEKPLCGPDLAGCAELWDQVKDGNIFMGVGYNHTLARSTRAMEDVIRDNGGEDIQTLSTKTREHWGGIFNAHPWLSGPEDSYLGFSERGGGACGEHSHAINIWQHFSNVLGAGRVEEVTASMDMQRDGKAHYDQMAVLILRTENGLFGEVIQDVVTFPTQKSARLQWTDSFAEWHVNYEKNKDAIITGSSPEDSAAAYFEKTRADDFKVEIEHLEELLTGKTSESPISLQRGLETMMVIAAAFVSFKQRRTVKIDWESSYSLSAFQ